MFTVETLIHAGKTFLMLFGELFGLFIGISFVVALLQIYISQERIKRILTTPKKGLNSVLGAALGSVTPFCSCSTIPVLVGLFKSGAPFCGAIPADFTDSEPCHYYVDVGIFRCKGDSGLRFVYIPVCSGYGTCFRCGRI